MSYRLAGAAALAAATAALAASATATSMLVSGCSDDGSRATGEIGDAGPGDATRSPGPRGPEEEAGPSLTCAEDCAALYPAGKTKDDAIVACWTASCAGSCTPGDAGGDGGDGGSDDADAGGADGGDGPACRNPVTTGDTSCDRCTEASCCAEWDGCFDDDECAKYAACLRSCPP